MKYFSILIILITTTAYAQVETLTYETGAIYTGEVVDGQRQGKGKITYPKGINEANMGEIKTKSIPLSPEMEKERKEILTWLEDWWSEYELEVNSSDYNTAILTMFQLRIARAEEISRAMGQDVDGRIKTVKKNGLASIQESETLGIEQKRFYYKKLYKVYVEALLNENPEEGYQMLRHYAGAAYHNREANSQDAMAENIMAESNYKTAQQSMAFIQVVGEFYAPVGITLDIVAAGTGEDPATGKRLTEFERFMKLMMIASPEVIGKAINKHPPLKTTLNSFAEKLSRYNIEEVKRVEKYILKHVDVPAVQNADYTYGMLVGYIDGKIKGAMSGALTNTVDKKNQPVKKSSL